MSVVKILIATDNHLGFCERDSVRCDDSFASFEEVLFTARSKKVDFVILAGDLFHENKPSRRTLFITMELLRKYCIGEGEGVYTGILNSDQLDNIFRSNHGAPNFEDPYQAIAMPVYAIHGNHDDPTREGGLGESLAALDLLAVNNLVNYIGKADKVDDIEIMPILMKKGDTHIALWGLGAIRDERLNRMWNMKKIKFIRPSFDNGRENFFNIFVVHQNRDYGRGKKNCLHESMIPEWMDLVIWGNEHESQPYLAESSAGFRIFQPGSSIATSLTQTESSTYPKHMGLVEIRSDKKFRMTPIKFSQIRPFLFRDESLNNVNGLQPHHPQLEANIKVHLASVVDNMIKEASNLVDDVISGWQLNPSMKYTIKEPSQVLLRLRVDPAGLPTINQQRFGSQFVGRIANPADLLIFAKRKRDGPLLPGSAAGGATRGTGGVAAASGMTASSRGDLRGSLGDDGQDEDDEADEVNVIHKIKVEELVQQTLSVSNRNLSVLAEVEMAGALEDYVQRKHATAFQDIVTETREQTVVELFRDAGAVNPEDILGAARRFKEKTDEKLRKGERQLPSRRIGSVVMSDDEDAADDNVTGKKATRPPAAGAVAAGDKRGRGAAAGRGAGGRGRGRGAKAAAVADDDDESEASLPRGGKAASARGRGGGRGSRGGRGGRKTTAAAAAAYSDEDSASDGLEAIEEEDEEVDDDDYVDDEAFFGKRPTPAKAAARGGRGKAKAAPAAAARATSSRRPAAKKSYVEDSEEIDDIESEEDFQPPSKKSASSSSARTSSKPLPLPLSGNQLMLSCGDEEVLDSYPQVASRPQPHQSLPESFASGSQQVALGASAAESAATPGAAAVSGRKRVLPASFLGGPVAKANPAKKSLASGWD